MDKINKTQVIKLRTQNKSVAELFSHDPPVCYIPHRALNRVKRSVYLILFLGGFSDCSIVVSPPSGSSTLCDPTSISDVWSTAAGLQALCWCGSCEVMYLCVVQECVCVCRWQTAEFRC